jgi:hypothetical protein
MKPLIAAEATTFVLTQKVAKSQDKKILPPTGKTPRPALFVGPLPAFNCGSFKVFYLNSIFSFSVIRKASGESRQNDGRLEHNGRA